MGWNPFKEIKKGVTKVFKKTKKEVRKVDPPNPLELIKQVRSELVDLKNEVETLKNKIPKDFDEAILLTLKEVAEKGLKITIRMFDVAIPDRGCGLIFGWLEVGFEGNPRKKIKTIKKWANNLPTSKTQLKQMVLECGPTFIKVAPTGSLPVADLAAGGWTEYTPKHFIVRYLQSAKEVF